MGCVQTKKVIIQDSAVSADNRKRKSNSEIVSKIDFIVEAKNKVKSNYKILCKLGAGAFGSVYKVLCMKTKMIRAMKVIRKEDTSDLQPESGFSKEIELLKCVDHPAIIKIFEYFTDEKSFYIITEFVTGGDLYETIVNWKEFPESRAAGIIRQLLSAVLYLHSRGIMHRDLKPENIMVELKNDEETRIKLIDFGSCVFLEEDKLVSGRVGTPYYMAPEVIKGKYNHKCDVWSCGVILYILLSGSPPFPGKNTNEIFGRVVNQPVSFKYTEWTQISKQAKSLISQMLEPDVDKRISIAEALENKWLVKFKEKRDVEPAVMQQIVSNIRKFSVREKFQKTAIAYIVHFLSNNVEQESLHMTFLALDLDGDGKLTYEELREGFSKVFGANFTDIEFNRIVGEIDQDDNGYIEYQEFLRAAMDQRLVLDEKNLKIAFNKFDSNRDNTLSIEELKDLLGNSDNQYIQEVLKKMDINNDGVISYVEFTNLMRNVVEKSFGKSKTMKDNKKHQITSSVATRTGFTVDPKKNKASIQMNSKLQGANISVLLE